MRSVDAIVLMGPVGSGKSTLGSELHRRGIAHFMELEGLLLERFGGREGFIKRNAEALEYIETSYERQLAAATLPVAFQATGLSDRNILLRLAQRYRLLYARINTPQDICVGRVIARPQDANLNNDPASVASFHDYWHSTVAPGWNFALELSGTDLEADVKIVRAELGL